VRQAKIKISESSTPAPTRPQKETKLGSRKNILPLVANYFQSHFKKWTVKDSQRCGNQCTALEHKKNRL